MMHSIRVKLVILLSVIVMGTTIICVLINSVFLGVYYKNSKEDTLNMAYEQLRTILKDDPCIQTTDSVSKLYNTCVNNGISLLVTPSPRAVRNYFASDMLYGVLDDALFERSISGQLPQNENRVQTITDKSGLKYLEMYGTIPDNTYFIMRISMEGIQQSVNISNRFFLYISNISIICSILIMWVVSNSFTKPILQLANISERMSNLDFDAKYIGNGNDEIDVLGKSMNKLSFTLETTISELKSANNELQTDINKKIEIDNMRKEFLSNVSHELKTPIALIQGYAEGLKEGIHDDPESKDFYCEVIIDESKKMNKMVKSLLTLNQLEFGNNQISMERFGIISMISGVLNSNKLIIEQKEAKVIFDDRKEFYVWADEFQIEQVITNYVTNALNHVDDNKIIRIDVGAENGTVKVAVFNSGKHIPEEDIDNIWVKFYKVDKARTREYGGNGIGLSIVKAAMEAHNRGCGVANVEDGVVFWFELDSEKV